MATQDDKPHNAVDEVKEDTSGHQLEDASHSAEKPVVAAQGAERITLKTWVVIFVSEAEMSNTSVEADNTADLVSYIWPQFLARPYDFCDASDSCSTVWRASILRLVWFVTSLVKDDLADTSSSGLHDCQLYRLHSGRHQQ